LVQEERMTNPVKRTTNLILFIAVFIFAAFNYNTILYL